MTTTYEKLTSALLNEPVLQVCDHINRWEKYRYMNGADVFKWTVFQAAVWSGNTWSIDYMLTNFANQISVNELRTLALAWKPNTRFLENELEWLPASLELVGRSFNDKRSVVFFAIVNQDICTLKKLVKCYGNSIDFKQIDGCGDTCLLK